MVAHTQPYPCTNEYAVFFLYIIGSLDLALAAGEQDADLKTQIAVLFLEHVCYPFPDKLCHYFISLWLLIFLFSSTYVLQKYMQDASFLGK